MARNRTIVGAMKGSVRKPRTAGGTWSYRLDLGLDTDGRRAAEAGRWLPDEEGRAGRAQRGARRLAARHLRGAVAPDGRGVPRAVDRRRSFRAGDHGVDELRRDHPPLHRPVPRCQATGRSLAARRQGDGTRRCSTTAAGTAVRWRSRRCSSLTGCCIGRSPTPCAGTSSRSTRRPERGCQGRAQGDDGVDRRGGGHVPRRRRRRSPRRRCGRSPCTPVCGAASSPGCGGRTSTSTPGRSPSPSNAPTPTTRSW